MKESVFIRKQKLNGKDNKKLNAQDAVISELKIKNSLSKNKKTSSHIIFTEVEKT